MGRGSFLPQPVDRRVPLPGAASEGRQPRAGPRSRRDCLFFFCFSPLMGNGKTWLTVTAQAKIHLIVSYSPWVGRDLKAHPDLTPCRGGGPIRPGPQRPQSRTAADPGANCRSPRAPPEARGGAGRRSGAAGEAPWAGPR